VPLFRLLVPGNHLAQQHEILSRNTRDFRLSYGKYLKSVSHLGLDRYRDVTPGQTDSHKDKITIANTRYKCMLALARYQNLNI